MAKTLESRGLDKIENKVNRSIKRAAAGKRKKKQTLESRTSRAENRKAIRSAEMGEYNAIAEQYTKKEIANSKKASLDRLNTAHNKALSSARKYANAINDGKYGKAEKLFNRVEKRQSTLNKQIDKIKDNPLFIPEKKEIKSLTKQMKSSSKEIDKLKENQNTVKQMHAKNVLDRRMKSTDTPIALNKTEGEALKNYIPTTKEEADKMRERVRLTLQDRNHGEIPTALLEQKYAELGEISNQLGYEKAVSDGKAEMKKSGWQKPKYAKVQTDEFNGVTTEVLDANTKGMVIRPSDVWDEKEHKYKNLVEAVEHFNRMADGKEAFYPGENANSMMTMADKSLIEGMPQEEKDIYNFLFYNKGEEEANKYLESLRGKNTEREAERMAKNMDGDTFRTGLAATAKGTSQFVEGMFGAIDMGKKIVNDSAERTDYSGLESMNKAIDKRRAKLGTTAGFAFDLVTTFSQQMVPMIASAITKDDTLQAILVGMSAGGGNYNEMIEKGYSEGEARTYGLLTGATEALLQKLLGGIGGLGGTITKKVSGKLADKITGIFSKKAVSVLTNAAGEFTEESMQDVLAPLYKAAVTGADTDIDLGEALYSGLLGASSSLLGAPIGAISNNVQESKARENTDVDVAMTIEEFNPNQRKGANLREQINNRVNELNGISTIGELVQNETEHGKVGMEDRVETAIEKAMIDNGIEGDEADVIKDALMSEMRGEEVSESGKQALASEQGLMVASQTLQMVKSNSIQDASTEIILDNVSDTDYEALNRAIKKKFTGQGLTQAEETLIRLHRKDVEAYSGKMVGIKTVLANENAQATRGEGVTLADNVDSTPAFAVINDIPLAVTNVTENNMVRFEDGTEIPINEVSFPNEEVRMQVELSTGLPISEREGFLKYSSPNISAEENFERYNQIKQLAQDGIPLDAIMNPGNGYDVGFMSTDAVRNAYEAGLREMNQQTTENNYSSETQRVEVADNVDINDKNTKSMVSLMQGLSQMFGYNVQIINDENSNSSYANNTITINLADADATDFAFGQTLSHEMVHWGKDNAVQEYNKYKQVVMEYLNNNGFDIESEIEARESLGMNRDEAIDEICAEFGEQLLRDSQAIKEMQKDKTVGGFIKKIYNRVKEMFTKLFSGSDGTEVSKAITSATKNEFMEIMDAYDEMIISASENARNIESTQNYAETNEMEISEADTAENPNSQKRMTKKQREILDMVRSRRLRDEVQKLIDDTEVTDGKKISNAKAREIARVLAKEVYERDGKGIGNTYNLAETAFNEFYEQMQERSKNGEELSPSDVIDIFYDLAKDITKDSQNADIVTCVENLIDAYNQADKITTFADKAKARIERQRDYYENRIKVDKVVRKNSQERKKLINSIERLQRKTASRNGNKVPVGLKSALADVLQAVNTESKNPKGGKLNEELKRLKAELNNIANDPDYAALAERWNIGVETSPEQLSARWSLMDDINKLAQVADMFDGTSVREFGKRAKGKTLQAYQFEGAMLSQAYKVARSIETGITKVMNLEMYDKFKSRTERAMGVVEDITSKKARVKVQGVDNFTAKLKTMADSARLSLPFICDKVVNFNNDSYLNECMRNLEKAYDNFNFLKMQWQKKFIFEKADQKSYQSFLEDTVETKFKDKKTGEYIRMTKAEIVDLALTYEREQNHDILRHLKSGALLLNRDVLLKHGRAAAESSGIHIDSGTINSSNIQDALKSFTEFDNKLMDKVKEFYREDVQNAREKWILEQRGYKPLRDDYYYQESTPQGQRGEDIGKRDAVEYTAPWEHALDPNANQEAVINSCMIGVLDMIDSMATKTQISPALEELNALLNSKYYDGSTLSKDNVREVIRKQFGQNMEKLITDRINNLAMPKRNYSNGEKVFLSALSAYQKSNVFFNLGTALKVGLSGSMVKAYVGQTAFFKGYAKALKTVARRKGLTNLNEQIDEWTGAHFGRSEAISQADLLSDTKTRHKKEKATGGRSKDGVITRKVRGAKEKVQELPGDIIGVMDSFGTALPWCCCLEESRIQLGDDAVGTKRYYEYARDIYNKFINETQSSDNNLYNTTMTQSNAPAVYKALVTFKNEEFKSGALGAYRVQRYVALHNQYMADKSDANLKLVRGARRDFYRYIQGQVITMTSMSLADVISRLVKGTALYYGQEEKDKSFWEMFAHTYVDDMRQMALSLLSPIIGNAVENYIEYGEFTFPVVTDIGNIMDAVKQFSDGSLRGNTGTKTLRKALLSVGRLFGIPANTYDKTLNGIMNIIESIEAGEFRYNGRWPYPTDDLAKWIVEKIEKVEPIPEYVKISIPNPENSKTKPKEQKDYYQYEEKPVSIWSTSYKPPAD